jgi:hypothetical protein
MRHFYIRLYPVLWRVSSSRITSNSQLDKIQPEEFAKDSVHHRIHARLQVS